MKKVFAFILMLIYGATSFGMTLHMHYCCGKLDKVSLSSKISKACKFETPGHNTVHSKNCCDNKTYEFKIKADQETSSQQVASFELQPINILLGYSLRLFYFQKAPVNFLSAGPPFLSSIPLFITNCVYRI